MDIVLQTIVDLIALPFQWIVEYFNLVAIIGFAGITLSLIRWVFKCL